MHIFFYGCYYYTSLVFVIRYWGYLLMRRTNFSGNWCISVSVFFFFLNMKDVYNYVIYILLVVFSHQYSWAFYCPIVEGSNWSTSVETIRNCWTQYQRHHQHQTMLCIQSVRPIAHNYTPIGNWVSDVIALACTMRRGCWDYCVFLFIFHH